jgi:hypothetical protein
VTSAATVARCGLPHRQAQQSGQQFDSAGVRGATGDFGEGERRVRWAVEVVEKSGGGLDAEYIGCDRDDVVGR